MGIADPFNNNTKKADGTPHRVDIRCPNDRDNFQTRGVHLNPMFICLPLIFWNGSCTGIAGVESPASPLLGAVCLLHIEEVYPHVAGVSDGINNEQERLAYLQGRQRHKFYRNILHFVGHDDELLQVRELI